MPKTEHSDYIAAYAAERGVPKRTAQDRFKKRHPDVMDWLTKLGITVHDDRRPASPVAARALVDRIDPRVGSPFHAMVTDSDDAAPAAMLKPDAERTDAERAECEMWQMFIGATSAARAASALNDITAAGFARTAVECFKGYQAAKAARIKDDIEARRLLPVAEHDMLMADVRRIVRALHSMLPDLAAIIDPLNPAKVLRAFDPWVAEKFNPMVRAFINEPLPVLAA
jgi:hypothetical protein